MSIKLFRYATFLSATTALVSIAAMDTKAITPTGSCSVVSNSATCSSGSQGSVSVSPGFTATVTVNDGATIDDFQVNELGTNSTFTAGTNSSLTMPSDFALVSSTGSGNTYTINSGASLTSQGNVFLFTPSSSSTENTLTNNGTLTSNSSTKPVIDSNSDKELTINNQGTIQQNGGAAYAVQSLGRTTFTNGGSLVGSVLFGSNADEFILESNGTIASFVDAADGSDTFTIGGSTDGSFDQSLIGSTSTYRNFEIYSKNGSSTWTLTGTGSNDWQILQGGLTISGSLSGGVSGGTGNEMFSVTGTFSGTANLGDGNDQFTLESTGSVTSSVDGGTGTDTFTLGGNTNGTFDQSQISSSSTFRNFETFTKTGSSTWTLSGTGSNDWTIEQGGLTVSGSLSGNVTGSSGSETFTISGAFSGTAAMGDGDDRIVLVSGATHVGILRGGGGTDTLELQANSNTTINMDNELGVEEFELTEKTGSAMLTLTGSDGNLDGGALTVREGTLRVNGTLFNGSVTVASGAFLDGIGQVAALTNSGTVAPGNSIGTLTTSGNFVQNSDGVLEIEISPSAADKLQVTGSASLAGTLKVIPESGTYVAGTEYTILSADGGVSGTFDTTTVEDESNLGGLSVSPQVTADSVTLVLSGDGAISAAASEGQQQEQNTETAETTNRTLTRTTSRTFTTRISNVFRSLRVPGVTITPGGPASPGTPTLGAPVPESTLPTESATGLAAGDNGDLRGLAVWTDTSFSFLDDDQTGSAFSGWVSSNLIGLDTILLDDRLVVGGAIGIDYAEVALESVDGASSMIGGSVSAYAGYQVTDQITVDGLLSYGRAHTETEQRVNGTRVSGTYPSNRYTAATNLTLIQPIEVADDTPLENLEVAGTVGYLHSLETFDPYTGSDGARVGLRSTHYGTARLTGEVSTIIGGHVVPYVTAGVEHDLFNRSGGSGRTGGTAGGGIVAYLETGITMGALYNASFGRGEESQHQFGANIRYSF